MLYAVVVDGLCILVCRGPVADVALSKRVVYLNLGIAVSECQGCHGIGLGRCGVCVHPVGGCLCALIVGWCGQAALYVGGGRAGVEVGGIGIVGHIAVAELVNYLGDVGGEVPCLSVGGGESDVSCVLAVDVAYEMAVGIYDEQSE